MGEAQGPVPHFVDFTELETHKENILPQREGRSVSALSHLYQLSADERQHYLDTRHAEFRAELERLDDKEDPLGIFYRYVQWTIEFYPEGPNFDSNLKPLLETVTDLYKDEEAYSDDPRYLRCWLLYARFTSDPQDLFKFLASKDIGQNLAAFYEEYAAYLEGKQKYDNAREVLELGIYRRAEPLVRLKRKFDAFQVRMMKRTSERASDDEADLPASSRAVLGHKESATSRVSRPLNAFNGVNGNTTRPYGTSTSSSNARITVFADENNADGASAVPSGDAEGWTSLGTDAVRRKENVRDANKWRGETQKHIAKAPRPPAFQVYRDE
ncbi:hypothetical protein BZG36_01394 [Bifiguratus adelaidae]|uniref:BUB1 N-terminal domain-containing protein n=1 Tax=Bifiguratus adelaidae TaxID=1938954 RepID=A0A261Y3J8_9FUNG|nr:hypothetical protein BZG36_01394 [Bifiguratus adelaidae]